MNCPNILIIEDEVAIRQMMKDVLEIQGYKVFLAANGKDGADILRSIAPIPCVILLDLMMPQMNGWDFLDIQRSDPKLKDIPVIVCSAYEESARSVKPHGFIAKPVQFDKLVNAVKAFCA